MFSILQSACTLTDKKAFDGIPPINNSFNQLNRNPRHIYYSKHARCRMDCRQINESDVIDLLHIGTINYKKSELNRNDCAKKYVVEGYEHHRHLRIVFASCSGNITVVTCIDLAKEWDCHCEGDPN